MVLMEVWRLLRGWLVGCVSQFLEGILNPEGRESGLEYGNCEGWDGMQKLGIASKGDI